MERFLFLTFPFLFFKICKSLSPFPLFFSFYSNKSLTPILNFVDIFNLASDRVYVPIIHLRISVNGGHLLISKHVYVSFLSFIQEKSKALKIAVVLPHDYARGTSSLLRAKFIVSFACVWLTISSRFNI